jgi:hypothetical protein
MTQFRRLDWDEIIKKGDIWCWNFNRRPMINLFIGRKVSEMITNPDDEYSERELVSEPPTTERETMMETFEGITTTELRVELERREQAEKQASIPQPLEMPNYQQLINTCHDYIHELAMLGYADEDYKHYIYEAALEAIYGNDVWTFINKARSG